MADPRLPISGCALPHPSDELLVGYLSRTVRDAERADVETHLRACDDCVQSVTMMRHLLSISDQMPAPVPDALRRKITEAVSSPVAPVFAPPAARSQWLTSILERLSSVFQPRLLVPIAISALALLVIVNRQAWFGSGPQSNLTRSLEAHETLRVTSPQASVWQRPGGNGSEQNKIIATLHRGDGVDIVGVENDWYRVVLSDKHEGWVERWAFE